MVPEPLLLCTDLDRTLIPNGPQPESPDARRRFAALVADPNVRLAYVSGRNLDLVRGAMRDYALPRPDFILADVGTNLYQPAAADGWQRLTEWHAHIAPDWGAADPAALRSLLADLPDLRAQEAAKQERFKLSYYVPLYWNEEEVKAGVANRLDAAGIRARLIYSIDEPRGIGLLDVLPESASKYHAIAFLLDWLGLTPEHSLFAGDSGNDLEVLVSPIPAVLVANGAEEVRRLARAQAENLGQGDRLYCARGGFRGMNGHYAAGILEGLAHFHPQWPLPD